MTQPQILICSILVVTIVLFIYGRWRHDVVALGALLACVVLGLLDADAAFVGFGHPAVITVACVLVLSAGLHQSGAIDLLTERLLPKQGNLVSMIAVLMGLGALLSTFMNNIGAMALLMPVAIQLAKQLEVPAGKILMPLAFGTILGGMTTMVGTPPNIIVSGFRAELGEGGFAMFDYTPVGLSVAVVGVLFVSLIGWRLVPTRQQAAGVSFDTGKYLTEVVIPEGSRAAGLTLWRLNREMDQTDGQIVGMVRNRFRVAAPNPSRILRVGDLLVIEAEPEALAQILSDIELALPEPISSENAEQDDNKHPESSKDENRTDQDEETEGVVLQELVVMPRAEIIGRAARTALSRFGVNLLALSRRGHQSVKRLRLTRIEAGDVLLMQGNQDAISGFANATGCIPLAPRDLSLAKGRNALLALIIMAIAVLIAAVGWFPATISFAAGMLAYMALRIVPPEKAYEAIDWSVIVLLGALIPVATVLATTGAADVLGNWLLGSVAQGNTIWALALILVVTMTLSDFMNNAATAAVMCPIALSTSTQLGANSDAFLMAVAVGASCAFLTPIGHQSNTLILGPGGFKFGDYWRLGLPIEILVVLVSVPMLVWVWGL